MRIVWIALSALFAVVGTVRAQSSIGFDSVSVYRVPLADVLVFGPVDVLVTIVEFSDFSCQYCVRVYDMLDDLMRIYRGRVRLAYRHKLFDPEEGTLAAEVAFAVAA